MNEPKTSSEDLAEAVQNDDSSVSAMRWRPRSAGADEVAETVAAYDGRAPGETVPGHVAQLVYDRLEDLQQSYCGQGRSLSDLGSPEVLAERMVAALPSPSPWGELGPFYGPSRVARLFGGVSRQAVADRRARGTLLGLKTADGSWVYPAFQFDERNTVLAGLPEVLRALRTAPIDDWTLASWLSSPMRSLAGQTPVDWLRQGMDKEPLLTLARDAARRFAQ